MKNLIILLFSLLLLAGCQKEQSSVIAKKQSLVKESPKQVQPEHGFQFEYVQKMQNGVFDTSFTSLKTALTEQQIFAKQVEENTYQASLIQDRLNVKLKKLESLEAGIDSSIDKIEKLQFTNRKLRKEYEPKYIVANSQDEQR